MIFVCDNCAFMFSQDEEPEQCPDCGRTLVRPANEVEQEEFSARMAEPWTELSSDLQPPNIADMVPKVADTFKFQMPISSLNIESSMLSTLNLSSDMRVAIMVEHSISTDTPNAIRANVWVKPDEATFSKMALVLDMPLIQDETPAARVKRIFEGLIGTSLFFEELRNFMVRLLEDQENYI